MYLRSKQFIVLPILLIIIVFSGYSTSAPLFVKFEGDPRDFTVAGAALSNVAWAVEMEIETTSTALPSSPPISGDFAAVSINMIIDSSFHSFNIGTHQFLRLLLTDNLSIRLDNSNDSAFAMPAAVPTVFTNATNASSIVVGATQSGTVNIILDVTTSTGVAISIAGPGISSTPGTVSTSSVRTLFPAAVTPTASVAAVPASTPFTLVLLGILLSVVSWRNSRSLLQ